MRRLSRLTVIVAAAHAALALADSTFPAAAVAHKSPLAGELRLRYLLRQIELTQEQTRYAEELLGSLGGLKQTDVDLQQIDKLWAELEEAKEEGDNDRVAKVAKQLNHISKDESLDREFFGKLAPRLNDRQKQLLAEARARLDRHRSGGLRPGDLMHEATKLNLTEQQKEKLLEAFHAARKRLGSILRPSEQKKTSLLNAYAKDVRAILTPEQRDVFEYRVYVMRPDLIDDGLYVPKSAVKWRDDESQNEASKPAKSEPAP